MTGAPARSFPEATAAGAPGRLPSQHAARAAQTRARSVLAVAGDPRSRRRRMQRLGGSRVCVLAWWEGPGGRLNKDTEPITRAPPSCPQQPPFCYHRLEGGARFPLLRWGRCEHPVCGSGFRGSSGERAGHSRTDSPSKNG